MLIVGGVIPLVVLIALNTKIYLAIRERTQRLATMTSRQRRSVSILRKKYISSCRAQKFIVIAEINSYVSILKEYLNLFCQGPCGSNSVGWNHFGVYSLSLV